MQLIEQFLKARGVGTPLICILTPDQNGTVQTLAEAVHEAAKAQGGQAPTLQLDSAWGISGINKAGQAAQKEIFGENDGRELPWALGQLVRMPGSTCMFFPNIHHWLDQPVVVQAILNLRDRCKRLGQTLIMLAPAVCFPAELSADVLILEEGLPGEEELGAVLDATVRGFQEVYPAFAMSEEERRRAIEAVKGLPRFGAENAFAWSLEAEGIDLPRLWSVKQHQVEQVRGVTFGTSTQTFADVGGLVAFREYMLRLGQGPHPISAIVHVDEIDKALAGSVGPSGDNGVAADRLGVLLQFMQEHELRGSLLLGVPGTGKTYVSEVAGNSLAVPTLKLDLRAATGGIQGESEAYVRQMLQVVYAVGGARVYFLATCNRLDTLPPELRRRFKVGPWFFDLPDAQEKAAIWQLQLQRIGLEAQRLEVSFDISQPRPEDPDWTGSDIGNCVRSAFDLGISLIEAARFVVPVAQQDPASVAALRTLADHSFLSAALPGKYEKPAQPLQALSSATGERRFRDGAG